MSNFNFDTILRGRSVRVEGSIDPGEAPTGPSYACGGTPGCPASIDDLSIFLIRDRKDGKRAERELADPKGKLYDELEYAILEYVDEQLGDEYE